jgi:hypothetical protein
MCGKAFEMFVNQTQSDCFTKLIQITRLDVIGSVENGASLRLLADESLPEPSSATFGSGWEWLGACFEEWPG